MASGAYLNGTDFKARLRRVSTRYPDVVGAGLFQETQIEATEVKKRTPVYAGPPGPSKPIPGVLRASVQAIGPFREGRIIYTKIIAGGAAGAYAARQHEETTWFHKIGQAKYIESVIVESAPFMASRVGKRIGLDKSDAGGG